LRAATEDRLHEEQRIGGCDWCTAARMAAYEAGALAMPVSGSGPTMLALAQPHAASAVRQALEPFTAARPGAFVLDLGFTDRSARLEAL
jgi:homoserine kinase